MEEEEVEGRSAVDFCQSVVKMEPGSRWPCENLYSSKRDFGAHNLLPYVSKAVEKQERLVVLGNGSA